MPKYLFTLILILCCNIVAAQRTIDLSGQWSFGTGEQPVLNDCISLPNSMITAGKGDDVTAQTQWTGSLYDSSYYFNPAMERYRVEGNVKFPFFLTPKKHYVGTAWYERSVTIPRSWKKRPVVLFLERPHIETTVFVNGHEVGHQLSLSTPHEYDITSFVRFGRENTIRIRVYNGIENVGVGQDSHSVTDQTQGNWNGIVGRIELQSGEATPAIRVVPDIAARCVVIHVGSDSVYQFHFGDSLQLWSEFHPYLYTRQVSYHGRPLTLRFGIRDISIQGRQFYLNGKPIWMRGTVENCCFPETGYPPTDEASWLRIFEKCRKYGLNHMRFHSYCPPEAAFAAADKVGFYLQPEGPSWPNHGVRLRRGQVIDEYLLEESKRIIDTYGHHPSFVMMAAGNEPAGDWVTYCNDWVKTMKQYDPTKVYCGASVGGGWAWDDGSEYHVKGGARGLDWDRHAPHSDDDYYDQILFPRNYRDTQPNESPIIAHEQGQWCAFPDFKEIDQYTGAYKARNFEIFRDLLADNGMASQAEHFLDASSRLQVLAYKYEIERNLRTRDYAGFQLLGLNDYSGQGTALVGPLNVHWREKSYIDAPSWREFCSPVVPLARFPKFVYESKDTLVVPVELYNASGEELADASCSYSVYDAKGSKLPCGFGVWKIAKQGSVGKNIALGTIRIPLADLPTPAKFTLAVKIVASNDLPSLGEGSEVGLNHWNFWVYPSSKQMLSTPLPWEGQGGGSLLLLTDTLDQRALDVLANGGDVLITAAGKVRFGNDVVHRYLPVFWNTSWFKMRPPHTTGSYILKNHPVFGAFPTDDWQNLNWWELVNGAQVMNLSEFPRDYQPIVQPIDTWHVSRKLGMLIEARVLNGRVLMTTMDITRDLEHRPVARQLRKSILEYMQSDRFQPVIRLEPQTLTNLFERTAPPVNMFTNESPDELKPALK
ncbi:MAG: beta-glucuronidase [Prevotella sp.]|nr:beta-glucuronidase [Prevotella sp.]